MTAAARKVPSLPSPYTAALAADRVLVVAASQIGYREGKSASGAWNNDTIFGKWYGLNFNAWCAMNVSWCSSVAGFTTIIPKHAYTPDGFNWFASRGLADGRKPPNKVGREATGMGKPRRGDVMYVYSASNGRISHVGFVEKVLPNGYVQSVEGNTNTSGSAQGDGVYRLQRKITSRLYFCHPQYAAVIIPRPSGPSHAKPSNSTPPKEEDPMAGITLEGLQTAFENALDTKLAKYIKGDNAHDSQEAAWLVSAQSYADIRMAQLLAEDKSPLDAMTIVKDEMFDFLAPLWATKK